MMTKHPLAFRIPHSAFRIRRNGMSMAEVLVALFLLALGTIAILTMFPLGMYHMGQALKDDRVAQSAQQADAYMRWYWRTNVVEPGPATTEPMVSAFDDPDTGAPFNRSVPSVFGLNGPSYPVFIDPMGWHAPWGALNSPYQREWVAYTPPNVTPNPYPNAPTYYPRRTLNLLQLSAPASQRACSLMDGFGFAENGAPSGNPPGIVVDRELRYNWMWILQRPDNTVPNTASMTVVVFDKRAFQYAQQGAEQVFPSGATPATTIWMQPLLTTIQVPTSQGVPPAQKGGWIMDATPGLRHAIFYRVVSVTDNPSNVPPTTDIEVQTPIRRLDGTTGAYAGTLMFFTGVSEVFERQNLTPYDF